MDRINRLARAVDLEDRDELIATLAGIEMAGIRMVAGRGACDSFANYVKHYNGFTTDALLTEAQEIIEQAADVLADGYDRGF